MSSASPDENSGCRIPKVSFATSIGEGLVGPNREPSVVRGMDKALIFAYLLIIVITLTKDEVC